MASITKTKQLMKGVRQLIKTNQARRAVNVAPDFHCDMADTLALFVLATVGQNAVEEGTYPMDE